MNLTSFDTLFNIKVENNYQDVTDSDYNSDVPALCSISEQPETSNILDSCSNITSIQPEEVLNNGILVETNKGVICMSLEDVLSSNSNLSVEDFKEVATQLLSQEDVVPISNLDVTTNNLNSQSSVLLTNFQSNEILLNNYYDPLQSTSTATSEAVDTSEETDKEKNNVVQPQKRRGGWPKGRKRKPELLHLPPKAPKTSYNIFLNERRKLYKDKLAFHEITRFVGNQWSSLTADEKQPYIERAEEDKRRYRAELQIYRRSDAYKLYLIKKRRKRFLDNLLSESDMDGTDDIDDEDNDMLYCDTCDQWFYNMHNKRQHLQSRQHKLMEAEDVNKNSTSLDESSMDAPTDSSMQSDTESVYDNMVRLISSVTKREKEVEVIKCRLQDSKTKQQCLVSDLNMLKHKSNSLNFNLKELKSDEVSLEQQLSRLMSVPNLFV